MGGVWRWKEHRNYICLRIVDASRTDKEKNIKILREKFHLLISCWNLALLLTSSRTTQRTWANTGPKLFLRVLWKYWPPFAVGHARGFKFKHSLSKLASFYHSCKRQSAPWPQWRWLPPCKPSLKCPVSINELSERVCPSCQQHSGEESRWGAQCALRVWFHSLYIIFPCCLLRLFNKNSVHVPFKQCLMPCIQRCSLK